MHFSQGPYRPFTIARLALLGSLALSLLCSSPAAAAGWLPPTDLSVAGRDATEPRMAVDAAGDAIVVWRHFNGSHFVIEAASRPAGGSFSSPSRISADIADASEPHIAMDAAGNAVAIWKMDVAFGSEVESATRPAGGTFSPPARLPGSAFGAIEPDLALNAAGEGIAIWTTGSKIEASSRSLLGFAPAVKLFEGALARQPTVGLNENGDAAALWVGPGRAAPIVVESASRLAGVSFSNPVPISAEGNLATSLRVGVDANRDVVGIWNIGVSAGNQIEIATGSVGGALTALLASGPPAIKPGLALNAAGEAVAVWQHNVVGGGVESSSSSTADFPFSTPVRLSPPGQTGFEAAVALDPAGDAVAVFNGDGVESARRPAGGQFSAAAKIADESVLVPQVALDTAGDAVAVWQASGGANQIIQAALYDATAPQLRGLSIPASGTAGEPLSFSVAPVDAFSGQASTRWSFGDGTTATGPAATHTYAKPGSYQITLTATDAVRNSTSTSATVTVKPRHPTKARASASRLARLRANKAILRLTCPTSGPCQGTAKLTAKRGSKKLTLGKRSFQIAAGKRLMLAIKLSAVSLHLIDASGHRRLLAKLSGSGVEPSTVLVRGRK